MVSSHENAEFVGVFCGFRQVAKSIIPQLFSGPGGQSSFLQKRMAKNTKYFDSGDYQVD